MCPPKITRPLIVSTTKIPMKAKQAGNQGCRAAVRPALSPPPQCPCDGVICSSVVQGLLVSLEETSLENFVSTPSQPNGTPAYKH